MSNDEIDSNIKQALIELRDWCAAWGARFVSGTEPVTIELNCAEDISYQFNNFDFTTEEGEELTWLSMNDIKRRDFKL